MGGWKTILLLKIFLFFYVHIRVCFAEQMSFSIINYCCPLKLFEPKN